MRALGSVIIWVTTHVSYLEMNGAEMKKHISEWGKEKNLENLRCFPSQGSLHHQEGRKEETIMKVLDKDD